MVWICRSNHAGPEYTELMCIPTEVEVGTTHGALGAAPGLSLLWVMSRLWQQPFFSSGFSSDLPGSNVPSAPEDHPDKSLWKTALVLSQAFQRVATLFPLWPETSQCPSLTSSVVIPAVDKPGRVWAMVVLHRCLLWTLSPAEMIYLQ